VLAGFDQLEELSDLSIHARTFPIDFPLPLARRGHLSQRA
jgi:hypothetical protein